MAREAKKRIAIAVIKDSEAALGLRIGLVDINTSLF
jgi:hypothetical protein